MILIHTLSMNDDLLDTLLGPVDIPSPVKQKLKCTIDYRSLYPNPVRRLYGGYIRPIPSVVTVCDSLCINNGQRDYEELINEMTRMSLARMHGLMAEKRSSRYERKQKNSK